MLLLAFVMLAAVEWPANAEIAAKYHEQIERERADYVWRVTQLC